MPTQRLTSDAYRPRIAVTHLAQDWVGGGEVVALAILAALKDSYDVTLISFTHPNLEKMQAQFGINLSNNELSWRRIPPVKELPWPIPPKFSRCGTEQRAFLHAMAFCRSIASDYDLFISTYNEMDLGKPSIQYVHYPHMAMMFYPGFDQIVHGDRLTKSKRRAVRCYLRRLEAAVRFGVRASRIRWNTTLANSDWTARICERAYRYPAKTVSPPVLQSRHQLPWDSREDGFVCVGRLTPQKRIDLIIDILASVRALGYEFHLHIVTANVADPAYMRIIENLVEDNDWLHFDWDLNRDDLMRLLGKHKFGIHAAPKEHFGISVAEMAKSGMIPFVHASGGQIEIVNHPKLMYNSKENAVQQIVAILNDPPAQKQLRSHIDSQASLFSLARFTDEIQSVVREKLQQVSKNTPTKL